uniref:ING domain-containing protein n=1 Tax=Caenorhabditis tropicalis TaxID=1561998 RepID=A0A1I7TX65_9PELO
MSYQHEVVQYAPTEDNEIHALIRGKPSFCKANIRVSTQQFQERLTYLDKRYDHLRKMTHSLRKKVNELEDIMRMDNDEENMETIKKLLEEIKKEKQLMRDEAHIIKGELSKTMYNEDLRSKILNFIDQFECFWYDDNERRLAGEWKKIEADRKSSAAESEASSSMIGEDDTPSTSSDGHKPYRETSM